MMIQSKKYKIRITKENFFQILRDRFRLPAENILYSPFINKNCKWINGKLESNSFSLSDYRFTNIGFNIYGEIKEGMNDIEVSTSINFKLRLIITQSALLLWFLLIFYLSNNVIARLSLILIWVMGQIGSYLMLSPIVKGFYLFFENLFKNEILIFDE